MTTYTSRNVPLVEATDPADIAARVNPVAQLQHDRPGVATLTTTQRNALTGAELWDGRIILNTTLDRLQRYDAGLTTWVSLADFSEIATLLATTGTPAALADTASRGVSSSAARADHVHAWPAWATWTPTYTNLTIGNGTAVARWVQMGRTIHFRWSLLFGSTSSLNASQASFTLPVAPSSSGFVSFPMRYYNTGTSQFLGFGTANGSSTLFLYASNAAAFNNTHGMTTSSNVDITGTYEAA